jgi:competence protein ComFC
MSKAISLRQQLAGLREDILGLVYPRLCAGCESPLVESADESQARRLSDLCEPCESSMKTIQAPFCSVCCQPFDGVMDQGFQCVNCGGRRLDFDFAACAYRSRGLARELIHRFKYERRHHLVRVLREMIIHSASDPRIDGGADWVVVPVPLHPRRKREREFNQAEEIARGLCRHYQWPMVPALRRVRPTPRQARLDRAERLQNLKGAFLATRSARHQKEIAGRAVILVDDVLTTGATASTCAGMLRNLGAAKVVVVTPVRG